MRHALHRRAEARGVHEGEHGLEALVGLADDPAGGTVEVEHGSGRGLDAHLVLERGADHAVARAEGAVGIRDDLGHDEERDAARALGCIRQAREHDVDDVLGEVVLAGADEDLVAVEPVAAVAAVFGLGGDLPEIGAALRLGEAHRAGPAALGQRRHVDVLQRLGRVLHDRVHAAEREAGIHRERPVGSAGHLALEQAHAHRQALAAVLGGVREALPAALHELVVGVLEAGRGGHHAVLQCAGRVTFLEVQRRQRFLAELRALLEDGADGVGVGVLAIRECGVVRRVVEHLVQEKPDVAEWGFVGGNVRNPERKISEQVYCLKSTTVYREWMRLQQRQSVSIHPAADRLPRAVRNAEAAHAQAPAILSVPAAAALA